MIKIIVVEYSSVLEARTVLAMWCQHCGGT